MNVQYDQDVDAVDVAISDGESSFTQVVDDGRILDYGADGTIVGIEFFGASSGVCLGGLPLQVHGIRAHELAQALKDAGVSVVDHLLDAAQPRTSDSRNVALFAVSNPAVFISEPPRVRITEHSGFQTVG